MIHQRARGKNDKKGQILEAGSLSACTAQNSTFFTVSEEVVSIVHFILHLCQMVQCCTDTENISAFVLSPPEQGNHYLVHGN